MSDCLSGCVSVPPLSFGRSVGRLGKEGTLTWRGPKLEHIRAGEAIAAGDREQRRRMDAEVERERRLVHNIKKDYIPK